MRLGSLVVIGLISYTQANVVGQAHGNLRNLELAESNDPSTKISKTQPATVSTSYDVQSDSNSSTQSNTTEAPISNKMSRPTLVALLFSEIIKDIDESTLSDKVEKTQADSNPANSLQTLDMITQKFNSLFNFGQGNHNTTQPVLIGLIDPQYLEAIQVQMGQVQDRVRSNSALNALVKNPVFNLDFSPVPRNTTQSQPKVQAVSDDAGIYLHSSTNPIEITSPQKISTLRLTENVTAQLKNTEPETKELSEEEAQQLIKFYNDMAESYEEIFTKKNEFNNTEANLTYREKTEIMLDREKSKREISDFRRATSIKKLIDEAIVNNQPLENDSISKATSQLKQKLMAYSIDTDMIHGATIFLSSLPEEHIKKIFDYMSSISPSEDSYWKYVSEQNVPSNLHLSVLLMTRIGDILNNRVD